MKGYLEKLAYFQDFMFDELPNEENNDFVIEFKSAIPRGINLDSLINKFFAYILIQNTDRIKCLHLIPDDLRKSSIHYINLILALHRTNISLGKEWDADCAEEEWEHAKSCVLQLERASSWLASSVRSETLKCSWIVVNLAAQCAAETVRCTSDKFINSIKYSARAAAHYACETFNMDTLWKEKFDAAYLEECRKYAKELIRLLKEAK